MVGVCWLMFRKVEALMDGRSFVGWFSNEWPCFTYKFPNQINTRVIELNWKFTLTPDYPATGYKGRDIIILIVTFVDTLDVFLIKVIGPSLNKSCSTTSNKHWEPWFRDSKDNLCPNEFRETKNINTRATSQTPF